MDSPFEPDERVAILTVDDTGQTVAQYGTVVFIEDDGVHDAIHVLYGAGLPLMKFMYSAPDDMWLRVVREGESVECTRLAKIVLDRRDAAGLAQQGATKYPVDGVFWDGILQEVRARLRENQGL